MRIRLRFLFLTALLVTAFANQAYAERYRISQDAFGNSVAEKDEKSETSESKVDAELPTELKDFSVSSEGETESEQDSEQGGRELSPFEKAYIESEKAERKALLEKLKSQGDAAPVDVTNIDESQFVDGDLLLEQGGIIDKDKAPYFITVDPDGTVRTTAYDPLLEKKLREKQEQDRKVQLTEATIHRLSAKRGFNLPDSKAAEILNLGSSSFKSYFDEFVEQCCEQLPDLEIYRIEDIYEGSRSFSVQEEDLSYRFYDGDSRYLLVEFPVIGRNYPFRFRTFIRSYKSQNVSQGVFYPQLVTLDKNKKPLRIISNPIFKYVPETWTSYAYLEGVFELEQNNVDQQETYLLIVTTEQALKLETVIDTTDESTNVKHMPLGSFELDILQDDI